MPSGVRLRHLCMRSSWQPWEVALASPRLFYRNGFAEETQTLLLGLSVCKAPALAFPMVLGGGGKS